MIAKNSKIFLAGHNGMVGSAILKKLKINGYRNIIFRTRNQLDLKNQNKVLNFFKKEKIQFVIIAAAKVGGIYANNTFRTEFLYENLMIQNNIIYSSFLTGIKNLIFLGSSCIYPKFSKQPIKEKYLLSGPLEISNDAYAVAKIAGVKMCEAYNKQYKLNYISLMPTNMYGPNDNYNELNSHFFPALMKKIYIAKKHNKKVINIWGDGKPKRELMYVDDLAEACVFFLKNKPKNTLINIGSGYERTIEEYAKFIMKKLNVNFKIKYDKSKPNGTPRKIIDSRIAKKYGWKSKYNIEKGFKFTFEDFLRKN